MSFIPADRVDFILPTDTMVVVEKEEDEDEIPKDTVVIEDARDYMLQPRYLKNGSKFRNYLYEHIFVGANVGVSKVDPRGGRNLAPGIPLSLFVGNYFNRLHGVRLTAIFQRYSVSAHSRDIKQAGADLDYMFNLTSYLDGYNPARVFSLSGTIGIGALSSHLVGWKAPVYKGQAGVHAAFHIRRTTEVFVEPFFAFTTDQLDHSGSRGNSENYDLQYGVKAGLSMRFGQEKEYLEGTTHNGNFFFEVTQGVTFYNSSTLPVRQTMGTGFALSMGKWFDPLIGMRITGHASDYLWGRLFVAPTESRPTYEEHRRAALFAGRGEVLINPMHFAKRAREVHRPFDLNIAVGGEVGRIVKYISGYEHGMKCNYVGFTAALQGLYNLNTSTSLFIEPRFLTAQYVIPYSNIPAEKAYNDPVFSLNAGVRFIRPVKEERKIRGWRDFESGCFANIQLGGLKQVMCVKRIGARSLNYSGGLQLGYEPFAFGGVKLGVEYMALNHNVDTRYEVDWEGFKRQYESQWHYTYGLLNTKLQLMFNLLNMYQGYDSGRRLAVYLNFGPAYALCLNQRCELYEKELQVGVNPTPFAKNMKGDGAWALNGSMTVSYRLAPRWSLYAEPEIQYYLKDDFIGRGVFANMKSLLVKFNIGTSFHF